MSAKCSEAPTHNLLGKPISKVGAELSNCSDTVSTYLYLHCTENPIYVFPEMKLRGLVPNTYIHVSVRVIYIPRIGTPIWLQQNVKRKKGGLVIEGLYLDNFSLFLLVGGVFSHLFWLPIGWGVCKFEFDLPSTMTNKRQLSILYSSSN